jgi:sulfhydrogenase subunit gamma (sulfur reductase)
MPDAILSEREPVGGALHRVRLLVSAEVAASHTRHGQYVELRHEETKGYFVLASPLGEKQWDLLLKEGGALADKLRGLPLGTPLVTSLAQGPGFPVDEARGRPLVLFATGSGIAAMLSTLGARIESGDAPRTYLLYGVRERRDVALEAEFASIRKAGIDVAICLSREHTNEEGFYKGYVQTVATARGWALAGGLAFAAGVREMVAALRAAAPTLGLLPEDIRLNH